jgi:hypothetical protein
VPVADGFVPGAVVSALEPAALALGRLDAALAAHPLRRAWSFWAELDAARRHAATDGRKVDFYRLAAHLHGLPLTFNRALSAAERGQEIASLNYTVGLRSWMTPRTPSKPASATRPWTPCAPTAATNRRCGRPP